MSPDVARSFGYKRRHYVLGASADHPFLATAWCGLTGDRLKTINALNKKKSHRDAPSAAGGAADGRGVEGAWTAARRCGDDWTSRIRDEDGRMVMVGSNSAARGAGHEEEKVNGLRVVVVERWGV